MLTSRTVLANAGRCEEALEWMEWGIQHDPVGLSWYDANLAWIYYLLGRCEAVVALARDHDIGSQVVLAASLARLGRLPEARAAVAVAVKAEPRELIAWEADLPLVDPLRARYLADLRAAGMREVAPS